MKRLFFILFGIGCAMGLIYIFLKISQSTLTVNFIDMKSTKIREWCDCGDLPYFYVCFRPKESGDKIGKVVEPKDGKEGLWKEYYKNGKLESERMLIDGKFEGVVKYYYPSGQLEGEGILKQGKCDGIWKTYYPNGTLRSELFYQNGKWEGIQKIYYENGDLEEEIPYRDGEKSN